MAATDLSPNTDNYYIGAGEFWFRPLVGGVLQDWRHMGNVPEYTFESTVETKEHRSSMVASRMVDKSVIISQTAETRVILEEWTGPNLAMWLLGNQTGADETASIDIGTITKIEGQIAYDAKNDIGPRWNMWLPNVMFRPSGALNPLNDDWGAMELIGAVGLAGTRFGVASRAVIEDAQLPAWGYVPV